MGRLNPEWQPWLRLLDRTLRALDDPVWAGIRPEPAADRPAAAPLLHQAVLPLESRAASRWVRGLLKAAATHLEPDAAPQRRHHPRRPNALVLLAAAAAQDHRRIEALAAEAGVDAHALGAVAQLAVRPLLHACGRQLAGCVPAAWPHGYCPVCGAWPALAELRGLDRARRLRCARCAGDWPLAVLHCPYCGEREHTKLGALVPEGEEATRRIETCASCRGYIKTIATLAAIPAPGITVEDLKTVDLELIALERGYRRPAAPGHALVLRFVSPRGRPTDSRIHGRFLPTTWRSA